MDASDSMDVEDLALDSMELTPDSMEAEEWELAPDSLLYFVPDSLLPEFEPAL